MLCPTPNPALWLTPPPEYSRLLRRLAQWAGVELFAAPTEWSSQLDAAAQRRLRENEDEDRWANQQADYAAKMAEYDAQGEHDATRLPVYLHKLGLSHKRTVQDRKNEGRFFERVIYCQIESWYYDEHAYYYKIDTGDLPTGLSILDFLADGVAVTLSVNFNAHVTIERLVGNHDRAGLWVVVEHQTGRGLIPELVEYAKMFKAMPKTAPPLAFPVGVGVNGKAHFADMEEMVTVLVVGSRGAGKSNVINNILCTWLQRVGPDKLRLFLTDLKGGLEFDDYAGISHLGGDVELKMRLTPDSELTDVRLGQEILTEPYQVVPVLSYLEREMARRQTLMRGKARKISSWNKKSKDNKLSYWVLVVDELATLMDSDQAKLAAASLAELARKGRAVGIFLILATQIPDKSVLKRQVAGNMDCRLVGRVADGASSALSLGDGSWDATRLPFDLPGRMIWRWNTKMAIQVPLIPEFAIKNIVKGAKGEFALTDSEGSAIAQELFLYALEDLAGLCSNRELFAHFRNTIAKHKIMDILKRYEVALIPDGLSPVIQLGDAEYYLLPAIKIGGDNMPRQLIEVHKFEKSDKEFWLGVLKEKKEKKAAFSASRRLRGASLQIDVSENKNAASDSPAASRIPHPAEAGQTVSAYNPEIPLDDGEPEPDNDIWPDLPETEDENLPEWLLAETA